MNLTSWTHNSAWKTMVTLAVLVAALFIVAPSAYAAGAITVGAKALVTNTGGDPIRVRDGAGTQNKQVAEAHEGDTVTVLAGPGKDSKGNSWYKVDAPSGSGWILSDFLSGQGSSAPAAKAPAASKISGAARVANTGGDALRMRTAPNSKGATITNIAADASVTVNQGPVTDSENVAWYQVTSGGLTGWVMAMYLAQTAAPSKPVVQAQPAAQAKPAAAVPALSGFGRVANTNGDPLRVRSGPSTKNSMITNLAPDSSVAIKQGPVSDSQNVAWYQVSSGGTTGWVMGQYLVQAAAPQIQVVTAKPAAQPQVQPAVAKVQAAVQVVAAKAQTVAQPATDARSGTSRGVQASVVVQPSNLGASIVSIALRYLGYRYVYGGTSPSGFDCSGFVYYVVNRAGKGISRDMYSQLGSGSRVSSKDLQPGDLLFFSNTYKGGLSHAGIYIGNGRFVHAENESTGVTISSLWSAYWASHYTAAVRVH